MSKSFYDKYDHLMKVSYEKEADPELKKFLAEAAKRAYEMQPAKDAAREAQNEMLRKEFYSRDLYFDMMYNPPYDYTINHISKTQDVDRENRMSRLFDELRKHSKKQSEKAVEKQIDFNKTVETASKTVESTMAKEITSGISEEVIAYGLVHALSKQGEAIVGESDLPLIDMTPSMLQKIREHLEAKLKEVSDSSNANAAGKKRRLIAFYEALIGLTER